MTDQLAQAPDPRQRPAPPPPATEAAPAAPTPDQPPPLGDTAVPSPAAPGPDDDALARLLASLPGNGPIHVTQPAWSLPAAGLPFDGHPPLGRDGLPPALAHPDDAPPPPPLLAFQHAHPQDHEFVPLTIDGVAVPGFGLTGVSGAVPVQLGGHVLVFGIGNIIPDGTANALSALFIGGTGVTGTNGGGAVSFPNFGSDILIVYFPGGGLGVVSLATYTGSSGPDSVTVVGSPASGTSLDLAGGIDTLVLAGSGGNVVSVANIESITGGAGADIVTATTPFPSGSLVDLRGGTDTLILSGGGNRITVANTEVVIGGNGGDAITVTGSTASSISGGSGADTITGGAGADTITGNGGGDQLTGGGGADRFDYRAVTDSFSSAAAATDTHTDVIVGFNDGASVIDFTALAGAGTETFTGLKTGASFAAAFAGGAAGDVDYAVIGGTTFVHVHQGAGYSAGDLLIALQGTHALTAANLHLHP